MPTRSAVLVLLFCLSAFGEAAPAAAANNDQEIAQQRIYIQQLEERVRQLTGENERLTHEVQQLSSQAGLAPPIQPGTVPGQVAGAGNAPGVLAPAGTPQPGGPAPGLAPDPMTTPDAAAPAPGTPIDLSGLAAGQGGAPFSEEPGDRLSPPAGGQAGLQTAGIPVQPANPQLSGNAREEYEAAYGYILTGDYAGAEQHFRTWLAAFPKDPQAADAQFWLGESYYQQGKAREAATAFLNLHNSAPQSPKAPDVLVRLGMSLAKLGEKDAACATLAEVGKRYPSAAKPVQQRVAEELKRDGC